MNHRTRFALKTLGFDLIAFAIAAVGASMYVYGTPLIWQASNFVIDPSIPVPMAGMLLAGITLGSWQATRWVEPHVARPLYARAFVAAAVGLGFSLVGQFTLRSYYSRSWVPLTLGGFVLLALVHRFIRRRAPWRERMVVVTDEKELAHDLSESPHAEVVEILDPRGEPPASALPPTTTLVVDLSSVMSDSMARYVSSSTLAGYDVRLLSNVYEEQFGRVALVHLAEGWEISVPLEQKAPYIPYKRILETALVLASSPLWLVLGLLTWGIIRLDSHGKAIFRQVRTGLNDRPFTIYKFRTMVDGADDDGPQFTMPGDPRVTRVGRWLRWSRLDEIPQLWNVLRGDLALVGPRAEQVAFTREFEAMIPFYRYRHLVRPGITGWAQVQHGYADDVGSTIEKLTYDLYYVRHMSPLLDLIVILKTVKTIFTGRGAQ
jgi:lipopolysaccharide/colanic/teichoic acid biosynthesis glycosyltransferase